MVKWEEVTEDRSEYCCCSEMSIARKQEGGLQKGRYIEGMDYKQDVVYCYTKWVSTKARLLIFNHCPFCGSQSRYDEALLQGGVPYLDHRGSGYEIERMSNGVWKLRIIGYGPADKKLEIACNNCLMCGKVLEEQNGVV